MIGRTPLMLMLLGGSVGVPYLATPSSSTPDDAAQAAPDGTPAESVAFSAIPSATQAAPATSAPLAIDPSQVSALPTALVSMEEALRWDLSPAWVLHRWPRVSTGMADTNYQGYRVAWISGTAPDDVAGSLTYYFDAQGVMQRMSFSGHTSDPRRFVAFLEQAYYFGRGQSNDPTRVRYESRWNGFAQSTLEITTARIVRAGAHGSFHVSLELNRKRPRGWL